MATKKTVKKETAVKAASVKAAPKAAAPVKSNDPEENIKRFAKTPLAMNFVKAHNGAWNHTDWLNFLRDLEEKGYFPIDTDRVGLILEDKKVIFFSK